MSSFMVSPDKKLLLIFQVALLCPQVQGGSCLHPPCLQPSVGMLLVTDLVCLKREETSVLDRKALKAPEATSISPHKESLQELPCLTSAELGSACVVLSAPFGNIPKVGAVCLSCTMLVCSVPVAASFLTEPEFVEGIPARPSPSA